jgi:hypothetical protein
MSCLARGYGGIRESTSCVQRLLERVNGIRAVPLALLRITDDGEEVFGIIAAQRRCSQPHRELMLAASKRVLGATVHN